MYSSEALSTFTPFSSSTRFSEFTHVVHVQLHFFLRLMTFHCTVCVHYIFFIYHGHLGCFPLWAIVNIMAVNIGVKISVRVPTFNSFEHIPRSKNVISYTNSVFNLLRNHRNVFHSGTLFYIATARHNGSNFSNSLATLAFFVCLFVFSF